MCDANKEISNSLLIFWCLTIYGFWHGRKLETLRPFGSLGPFFGALGPFGTFFCLDCILYIPTKVPVLVLWDYLTSLLKVRRLHPPWNRPTVVHNLAWFLEWWRKLLKIKMWCTNCFDIWNRCSLAAFLLFVPGAKVKWFWIFWIHYGLQLDFKFKFHIDTLANKLWQKIGYLYRNKANFPVLSRKQIIEAIFLSVLDYGDIICRHASASTLKPLDSVYHSALRFITGDSYSTYHCILYEKVGWASLTVRCDSHWFLFIYKALNGNLSSYITTLLNWSYSHYSSRSNDWPMLEIPCANTEFILNWF